MAAISDRNISTFIIQGVTLMASDQQVTARIILIYRTNQVGCYYNAENWVLCVIGKFCSCIVLALLILLLL